MNQDHFSNDNAHKPPRIEAIRTEKGKIFRVHYGGMCKEHSQEWQAQIYYQMALDMWGKSQNKNH